jgi:pyruvate,water dikinase
MGHRSGRGNCVAAVPPPPGHVRITAFNSWFRWGQGLPPELFHGGMTASPGVASGPVHRVTKEVDALAFPDGAVLVTDRALARWATLLPRAAAVVSEKGGLTGHLANVAREFRVPALFGAAGAIGCIDGQTHLTVDADAHRIYAGQVHPCWPRSATGHQHR